MTENEHVCVPVVDDAGQVIGHARVSPDLGDVGLRHLAAIVAAAQQWQAERDAADPEGAAERARRQEAGRARNAERLRRIRGEAG